MIAEHLSETSPQLRATRLARDTLVKFERAKILEVYFSRLDGRQTDQIPASCQPLYEIELSEIKNFLLGQHPQDSLLQRLFRLVH